MDEVSIFIDVFKNCVPGDNAEKKYDYEINEKFLRKSQATKPNLIANCSESYNVKPLLLAMHCCRKFWTFVGAYGEINTHGKLFFMQFPLARCFNKIKR